MNATSLIGYAFAAMVTFSCAKRIVKGGLMADYEVFRHRTVFDWVEITLGDLVAVSVLIGFAFLVELVPKTLQPILRWSWLDLLAGPDKAGNGRNQMIAGATIPLFGIAFVIILFLNLPRLAEAEELSFRQGTRDWWHALPRSLYFGLMHMVVGVPLWLGLGLSVPGLWFTKQYFKGGVSRSTMAHALYNMMIASVLFVYVLFDNASRIHLR